MSFVSSSFQSRLRLISESPNSVVSQDTPSVHHVNEGSYINADPQKGQCPKYVNSESTRAIHSGIDRIYPDCGQFGTQQRRRTFPASSLINDSKDALIRPSSARHQASPEQDDRDQHDRRRHRRALADRRRRCNRGDPHHIGAQEASAEDASVPIRAHATETLAAGANAQVEKRFVVARAERREDRACACVVHAPSWTVRLLLSRCGSKDVWILCRRSDVVWCL